MRKIKTLKTDSIIKHDGWSNIFTNVGVKGKDKRTGARLNPFFLTETEAENFYQADDIASKIVDRLPEEMTREGFEIYFPESDDHNKEFLAFFKKHNLDQKIEKCLKLARLYGGSALLIGADDGQEPDQPLKLENLKKIDFFTALSRYDFKDPTIEDLDYNVASENYKKPEFYELRADRQMKQNDSWNGKIHYTRLIRFEGVPVEGRTQKSLVNYWGDSVLSRLFNVISNFQLAHDSAALIMQDAVKLIVKLRNLSHMLAQGDDALVTKRLQLLATTSSAINAIVIQDDEEAESRTTQLSGIPELLDRIDARLIASTDMPHTILFNEGATGGIGNKGESEKRDWYDHVKNKQESILRPVFEKIIEMFFSAKDSPTSGNLIDFNLTFKPLWLPTEKEIAETRKIVADADRIYFDIGAISPEEIAESRWGSGQYSMETKLDDDLRSEEDLEDEEQNEEQNSET